MKPAIRLTTPGELRIVGKADWNQYDLDEGEEAVLVPATALWRAIAALPTDVKSGLLAELMQQAAKPFPDTDD